jgi:hypothetical protein
LGQLLSPHPESVPCSCRKATIPPFWQGLNSLKRSIARTRFRDSQPRFEGAGIRQIVDVNHRGARDGFDGLRFVVHVIPAGGIVEPAHHVDAIGGEYEVAVVQIVLIGRVQRDRGARLLARVRALLGMQAPCDNNRQTRRDRYNA